MCGITGFWASNTNDIHQLQAIAQRMARPLKHRGPDDEGAWADASAGVAFGFCRLAILDLTPEGHQPMLSASGRYVIAFNGEVYNFAPLRHELERVGHFFRGRSDTEVMLAAIEQWGLEAAVRKFIGMFAFALWDSHERKLHLVRDRLGIKPLYYGWLGSTFLFASELKAIRAHPEFHGEIDRGALALLMRHNYIPTPRSIYQGFYKLTPGTILTLRSSAEKDASSLVYWSARETAEKGLAHPFYGSEREAQEQLDLLLRDSIKLRMIADVPLGAFLSGGVDSSTVVALMQAQSDLPIKTFTIGFHEDQYDEAARAREVARHLGTDHTELYLSPREALDVIPKLPSMYDEPFADSSQIPTHLISRLAREQVTVSLSGDGGDELFGGYNRYFWGRTLWPGLRIFPVGLRALLAKLITGVSPEAWTRIFSSMRSILPRGLRQTQAGDKLHKLAGILDAGSAEDLYRGLISHWSHPEEIVISGVEPKTRITDGSCQAALSDFTLRMMYLDLISYLPDDILTKVDRASMAISLEARVPMLDHRLVEFAWSLPLSLKVRNGRGKHILRQVLYQYVPKELIERPKMGFAIPIDAWLRGPLRDWAQGLLDEHRLKREGFFRPEPVCEKWDEHLSGKRNWQYQLWDVLMFQAWLEAS